MSNVDNLKNFYQYLNPIPANTATNGTYKLQSSTTAGNVTYTWVEDSGGASLPTPPTTDGNYILKVSVSSGTPTYSWVEVT
jgi:hypothetical protein